MNRENIYLFISTFLLIVSSFYLGYNLNDFKKITLNELKYNISNCSGFDLFETSECLNQQLKEFFIYNSSNIGTELTLDKFKEEGGVCSHASKYYKENAEELGFYGSTCIMDVILKNNTLTRHEIAIISNKEGYVVLDQGKLVGQGYFKIDTGEITDG